MKTLVAWWLLAGLAASVWGGVGGTNARPVSPTSVTLLWDASPDASVIGYALYWAEDNSAVTNRIDVGQVLTATVAGLPPTRLAVFVVAYNSVGTESVPSNILELNLPVSPVLRVEAILQVDNGGGFTNAVTMGIFDLGETVGSGLYRVVMAAKPLAP